MAKEKVVELEIKSNLKEVTEDVHDLEHGIEETTKKVDHLADSYERFADRASKSTKKATSGFKKAGKEADKFGKGIKGVQGVIQMGADGLNAYQGALGLIGVESDKVQEQLMKVNSAMSLSRGIAGFNKNLNATIEKVKDAGVVTKIATMAQTAYTTVIGASSGALKIFRIAMISTGIGALVVGLGLLIANFGKISKLLKGGVVKGFKKAGVGIKLLMIAFAPLIATIKLVQKGLELIGVGEDDNEKRRKTNAKTAKVRAEQEKKEHKEKLDRIKAEAKAEQDAFDRKIALMKALGEETSKIEQAELDRLAGQAKQDRLDQQKEFNEEFADNQKHYDKQLIRDKEQLEKALLEASEMGRNGDVSAEITYRENRKVADHMYNKSKLDAEKKYLTTSQDQVEEAQNKADIFKANTRKDQINKWKSWSADRLSIARKIQDLEIELMEEGIEKELEINKVKFERLIKDMTGNATEKAELKALYERQEKDEVEKIWSDHRIKEQKAINDFFGVFKEINETYDKGRDELNEKRIEKQDAQYDLELELMKEGKQKEIQELVNSYNEKFEIAEGNAELEKQLEKQLGEDIEAIKAEYREKDRQAKLKAIDEGFDIAKQGADALQGLGDLVFSQKMKNVKEGSKEEEELAKKQFKFNKAMQLSGAVIDAGKAIIASLAQAPLAIGVVPNPIGIASLAMVATTSAINIAKIASTKFGDKGKADTPSGSLGAGEVITPEFNIVGDSQVDDLEGLGEQPLQAYVVSGDVTSAQSLDRNRVENATI
tara:strand:+ start:3435 stop:5753 length:2319 start_codon:yes stop_codon:yes gene_type:complete